VKVTTTRMGSTQRSVPDRLRSSRALAALFVTLVLGCGAKTGVLVPKLDGAVDAGRVDGGTVTPPSDAGVDAFVPIPDDAGTDAGPDAFVPLECPGSPSVRAREATVPVDVVWTLDSSGSMGDDIERMQANIDIFWDAIIATDLDIRVIFVAERDFAPGPPAGFVGQYISVDYEVSSWAGLAAFTATFDMYERYLRPDATTHFITVTDDDSLDMEWEDFYAWMTDALGHEFTFHAVASERIMPEVWNPLGACYAEDGGSAMRPGRRYYALAEETGGLTLSICNSDWGELWEELTERIVVPIPLPCAFRVPPSPTGLPLEPDRFRVVWQVEGEPEPRIIPNVGAEGGCGGGWWWNGPSGRVQLCASACEDVEALGGRITIDLDCVTPPLP